MNRTLLGGRHFRKRRRLLKHGVLEISKFSSVPGSLYSRGSVRVLFYFKFLLNFF